MRIAAKAVLIFSLFAVLCVGVTAAVLIKETSEEFEATVSDRQLLLTQNRAGALRDNLELAVTELTRLARVADINLEDTDAAPEHLLLGQAWRRSLFFNHTVELIDPAGTCRWSEPEPGDCSARSYAASPWFRMVSATQRPVFAYLSELDGTGIVQLVVPVLRDRKLTGVLKGEVDLKDDRMASPILRESVGPSSRAFLVSQDGTVVYASDPAAPPGAAVDAALKSVRAGGSGAETFESEHKSLVAWAPVEYGGLGLVLVWDWDSLHDPRKLWLGQIGWLLLGVAALALTVGYLASKKLVQPIQELADLVPRAEPQFPHPFSAAERPDEIGQLQRAFGKLLESVAERNQQVKEDMAEISRLASTLEERVRERTRELEQAQAALVQSERLAAVGRAGTVLSHELRNALNSIGVGVDLIVKRGPASIETARAQQQVRAEVARLRALSDDLLSFAGEPRLRLQACDVVELVRSAVDAVQDSARAAEVEVVSKLEPQLSAQLDPARILTVFMNLLQNGIEAAASGQRSPKRVALEAKVSDGQIIVRVSDTGPGVDASLSLFQPFSTTKRNGVGLGLAIAERFIKAHGGTIVAKPGALGGACFELQLPLSQPTIAAAGLS